MTELTWTGADIVRMKQWAKAHSYAQRRGGWIYDKHGSSFCQGWWNFYKVWHDEIAKWEPSPEDLF